jgi:two-component system, LytTR family, response regulator
MHTKTIIIEDEEKNLFVISDLIHRYAPTLELCGTASHVAPAARLIESVRPNLVLMDVRIGDGTGFDVLRALSTREFELIFITAYDSYALEAIRFAAIDYLLKPVGIAEFKTAIERAENRLKEKTHYSKLETLMYNLSQTDPGNKKLSIPSVSGYEFVNLSDIVWCKSEGSYTIFYLADRTKITSSRNIGFYEEIMNINDFYRVSNSVMFNLHFLKSYSRNQATIMLNDGTELAISTRRKGDFVERLKTLGFLKGF